MLLNTVFEKNTWVNLCFMCFSIQEKNTCVNGCIFCVNFTNVKTNGNIVCCKIVC